MVSDPTMVTPLLALHFKRKKKTVSDPTMITPLFVITLHIKRNKTNYQKKEVKNSLDGIKVLL
jgi:hypothetical protein